jgi:hypothetical protein
MNEEEYEKYERMERKRDMSAKYSRDDRQPNTTFSTKDSMWYEYNQNVVMLGYWLHANKNLNEEQLLYYFEKPWKYSDEWLEMNGEEE